MAGIDECNSDCIELLRKDNLTVELMRGGVDIRGWAPKPVETPRG